MQNVTVSQGEQQPSASPGEAEEHSHHLISAACVVSFMTILSRVLGLWRFRLMAGIFGATGVADAFNFAFIFPNLTRRLFGEGALTSAFVPVFSDRLARGDKESASRTGSVLLCRLGTWLTLGCLALMAAAHIARIILPRVMGHELAPHFLLELDLFEWMLPYLIFINLAAILMGILNSMDHFAMPAFAPVLLNVFMIVACKWLLPYFGTKPSEWIWALAYAVLAGGVCQLLIQIPPAIAGGFRFKPSLNTKDPGFEEVMANFKPVLLLVAVFQINVLMDNVIAQVLISESGPVTYLNMGTSVYQLAWSVFALALATAALPALSKFWTQANKEGFVNTMLSALRLGIFLMIPCTVGIMLLSEDIVRLLYGTGQFLVNDAEPVRRTAGVVTFSSLGLVFFGVNAILARALYAMKDMKTPTTTSAQSVAINLVLNLALVLGTRFSFKTGSYDPDGGMKEAGIALASTLSNAWQTWMLVRAVQARLGTAPRSSLKFILMLGGVALLSAPLAIFAYYKLTSMPDTEGFWGFFAAIGIGLLPFYFVGRMYFFEQLKDKFKPDNFREEDRYGVPEELWSDDLKFQHSIYTTIMCSAIMGFLVWAVRDSLPPEGRRFDLVFQRAVVPVVAGVFVYMTAASGFMAREYDEVMRVLRRFRSKA